LTRRVLAQHRPRLRPASPAFCSKIFPRDFFFFCFDYKFVKKERKVFSFVVTTRLGTFWIICDAA
jgi:hypothetical protein